MIFRRGARLSRVPRGPGEEASHEVLLRYPVCVRIWSSATKARTTAAMAARPGNLLVIGAGIAGLSAGCYAARSGYRVTILEMHDLPGGLCTSWRRKGYLFDGSVAGLAGTSPEMAIFRLWRDLGVIGHCPLYDPVDFGTVVDPDGRRVTVFTDVVRLEDEFLAAFPMDAAAVREFCAAVRACGRLDLPFKTDTGMAGALTSLRTAPATLRTLPSVLKYGRMTLREFTSRLTDPLAVLVFANLVHFGGPDVPLLTVLLPLAYADRLATGIPLHGWLSFSRAVERRFLDLGGEVRYGARVAALTTDRGRVTGVRLADGEEVTADRVLSAVDGRFTRSVLLGEPEWEVGKRYNPARVSDQPVQVNLGVAKAWDSGAVTLTLPERPDVAGRRQSRVTLHTKHYDPEAAPAGKSAITAFLESSYDHWRPLAADREAYAAEKRACADLVVAALERELPGAGEAVEVVDISTPLTRERYTGNWLGAMQARRPDSSLVGALLQRGPRYDHPELDGFWMAGQWVESWGGITTAAQSGRNAVRALCRKDGARFGG
jgi:phytoene dehydrogenase-like protein